MTTIAPDADRLRELDAGTRRAWNAYRDKLSELTARNTSAPSRRAGESSKPSFAGSSAGVSR